MNNDIIEREKEYIERVKKRVKEREKEVIEREKGIIEREKESKEDNERICDILIELIHNCGKNGTRVARDLGMHHETLSRFTHRSTNPDFINLIKIANYFGLKIKLEKE